MPRAQAACSAAASPSAGHALELGSVCSAPESAYSGGSSSGGPHPQSYTSSESGTTVTMHANEFNAMRENWTSL